MINVKGLKEKIFKFLVVSLDKICMVVQMLTVFCSLLYNSRVNLIGMGFQYVFSVTALTFGYSLPLRFSWILRNETTPSTSSRVLLRFTGSFRARMLCLNTL